MVGRLRELCISTRNDGIGDDERNSSESSQLWIWGSCRAIEKRKARQFQVVMEDLLQRTAGKGRSVGERKRQVPSV
jgi:hypothetical protein